MTETTSPNRWSLPSKAATNLEPKDDRIRLETRASYTPFIAFLVIVIPIAFIFAGILQYALRKDSENEELRKNSVMLLALYVPLGVVLATVYLIFMPKIFRIYDDGTVEAVNWAGCAYFRMKVRSVERTAACAIITGCVCKLATACSGNLMLTAREPTCGCISKLLISPQDPEGFLREVQSVVGVEEQV